jgi:hypothetical protein
MVELPDSWEEPQLLASLQEVQASVRQLTDVVDSNLSLLEDSVREVRTARQIAAESNRLARVWHKKPQKRKTLRCDAETCRFINPGLTVAEAERAHSVVETVRASP